MRILPIDLDARLRAAGVRMLTLYHDEWCQAPVKPCTCDPYVSFDVHGVLESLRATQERGRAIKRGMN